MTHIYPLNPVVCCDTPFRLAYNTHRQSTLCLSESITPVQFKHYIRIGNTFKKIILINNAGRECLPYIGDLHHWDDEILPIIKQFELDPQSILEVAMAKIHAFFSLVSNMG